MIHGKKVVVVMPAYNAEQTLKQTHEEVMAQGVVDLVIVVDDASKDKTMAVADGLPQTITHRHASNRGYGANQKTCYNLALENGADIVIMVHADYQYTPKLIPAMAGMLAGGLYHCVFASRILGGYALKGGMPLWRYVANRALTWALNLMTFAKLSEWHSGYRAFTRELLESVPYMKNSDDYVFDNQMLLEILWKNYQIAEISCPTKYFDEASSPNLYRSTVYGLACCYNTFLYWLARRGLVSNDLFEKSK